MRLPIPHNVVLFQRYARRRMGGDNTRGEMGCGARCGNGRPVDIAVDGAGDLLSPVHGLAERCTVAHGLGIQFHLDPVRRHLAEVHL